MSCIQDEMMLPFRPRNLSLTACASRSVLAPASSRSNAAICSPTELLSGRTIAERVLGPRARFLGGALRLLGERGERGRTRRRELREALAVEGHPGDLQPVDQLTVGQSLLSCGGVDADDPESPEITLLVPPADERVLECGVDRFFRGAIKLALVRVVTLRKTEELLPLGAPNRPSF